VEVALILATMAMVGWKLTGGGLVSLERGIIQRPNLFAFVTADNGTARIDDRASNFGKVDGATSIA
jgi:hypothetical protein